MLNFIKAQLQTLLTALGTSTTLRTVQVVTEKSDERTVRDYLDHETLLIVARELPSLLPQIPIADRFTSVSLTAYAVETEKENVSAIINDFIDTYNGTKQSAIGGIFYFTNLIPTGLRENIGAYRFGSWTFAVTFRELSGISSIYDREIQMNSTDAFAQSWVSTNIAYWNAQDTTNRGTSAVTDETAVPPIEDPEDYSIGFCMRTTILTNPITYAYYKVAVTYTALGALNGLVSYSLTVSNVYTSLPSSGGYDLVLEAKRARVQFVFLDSVDTVAQAMKAYGYAATATALYINAASGGVEQTIYAKLIDFNDTANTQGFPVLTMIFEGRLV